MQVLEFIWAKNAWINVSLSMPPGGVVELMEYTVLYYCCWTGDHLAGHTLVCSVPGSDFFFFLALPFIFSVLFFGSVGPQGCVEIFRYW